MGVTTESGILIGQVYSVGAVNSTVITVLDTRFSAAVFIGGQTIEDSDGRATAKGDFNHMRNGHLIIDYIDDSVIVNQGSFVVTSGAGTVFPSGLTVGEVVRVDNHSNGIGRYATVRPSSPLNSISRVYIILGYENVESVESVESVDQVEDPFDEFDEEQSFD